MHFFLNTNKWCTIGYTQYQQFLILDNGVNAKERILVFGTIDGVLNLSKCSTWYLDGKYSLVPKLFLQLYVIRVEISDMFITVIYCLLERKTVKTYKLLFQTLVEKCAE